MMSADKLNQAQRKALSLLLDGKPKVLFQFADAGIKRATLDALNKRGLIQFGSSEFISLVATVQHFRDMQESALYAEITDAGRSALLAKES